MRQKTLKFEFSGIEGSFMKVTMIGTGYVGLVSGVCFSDFGHDVICVDKDPKKITALNAGQVPIFEPGLDDLMAKNVKGDRLSFTGELNDAVGDADAVFIAVGTPTRRGDGHADLSYVYAAAEEIAHSLKGYTVVVTKSTVPVGTNRAVYDIIKKANPNADFDVASNPEFLREGAAIDDFMRPDRVVVGCETERAKDVMAALYRPLSGMGLDGRIGDKFLHAGPGYGGSCFPKDTKALARIGQEHASPVSIVETVIEVNDRVKRRMIDKVMELCDDHVNGKKIAVFGVTFKPNTDDMRDAPSLSIVPALVGAGANVTAVDPEGRKEGEELLPGVAWEEDAYEAATDADAVLILTEWNEFRGLDLERLAKSMKTPAMADLRNVYRPDEAQKAGFKYISIGRSA